MCQIDFLVISLFLPCFLIIIDRFRTILFIFEHARLCLNFPFNGCFRPLNLF